MTGSIPAVTAPEFIGREQEMALLLHALGSSPAVVLVEGEAGIGKTRLIQEFLEGQSYTSVVACCPPFRQPQTLGPVVDALRQAVGQIDGLHLSALAGALRRLFPEWAAHLPPALEPAEDASAARHRVFCALAELVDRLEVDVLVVEDAQWADDGTIEFLLYLATRQPRQVSLVITSRPDDTPADSLLPRLARQAAGRRGTHLTLNPLSLADTARLVSSMLAEDHVSGEFASFLYERTDGVPLAVEESVRLMAARGDVVIRGGELVRRHLADITIPPTICAGVLERAGQLPQEAQGLLWAAAVLAAPADEPTLRSVADVPIEQARAGIAAALESGLLAEAARGLVTFRHVLTTQVIYEAIPAPHRRALHLRAGNVLEQVSQQPVDRLAHHFLEAGETERWSHYAEQAVDLALESGDEATAIGVLADLITQGGQLGFRAASRLDKVTFGSVDDPGSYQRLIAALRTLLAEETGGAGEVAQARYQLGRLLSLILDIEACRAELRQATPMLASDPARAARAMSMLGWPLDTTAPASEHRRWLDQAEDLATSLSSVDQLRVLIDRATALLLLGEDEGWLVAASMPEDSAVRQERQLITVGYLNTAEAALMWGRYADARVRLARSAELAERHGYARHLELIRAAQMRLDWLTGSWDGLAERAQRIVGGTGTMPGASLDAALVISLMNAAHAHEATAKESLRAVVHEWHRRQVPYMMMEPAAALARLHLAAGRVDDALQATEQPVALIMRKGIWLWGTDPVPVRASALIAADRPDEGGELVAAFASGLRGHDAPAPKAALTVCWAMLAEAHGEYEQGAALYGHAATAWHELPRPYDALLAEERQALCKIACGRKDDGIALLTVALRGLLGLGARNDAERVSVCLRRYGVRTRPGRRGGRRGYGGDLSPRELEVVQLLVAGRSRQEIAQTLFRSPKTVDTQLTSAMVKLGVASRAALAARVVEAGLVPVVGSSAQLSAGSLRNSGRVAAAD